MSDVGHEYGPESYGEGTGPQKDFVRRSSRSDRRETCVDCDEVTRVFRMKNSSLHSLDSQK